MVNSVQGTNSTAAAASSAKTAASAASTQDRFLQLLVTQMKNQDPLNPMDNAQVTSQMAQLSTVTGIDKLNSTVQSLSDSMAAAQTLSATSMIGHGVLVPGTTLGLNKGQAIAGLNLGQGADTVKVLIKDGANNIVRTLQMGAQKPGVIPLAWDGLNDAGKAVPDGSYKISAEAVTSGKSSAATTLSFGTVDAVTPGAAGAKLNVGKLGEFVLSDIKQVL
ncbi:MAG: flagellar hook assembly protein FlgD [Gallionellaceae bacterium]|nr:MAG: flagellar hook assembly protein FlgD [Gallionellaceae bacterium]